MCVRPDLNLEDLEEFFPGDLAFELHDQCLGGEHCFLVNHLQILGQDRVYISFYQFLMPLFALQHLKVIVTGDLTREFGQQNHVL